MLVFAGWTAAALLIVGCYDSTPRPSVDAVNVETAEPEVVLARLCEFVSDQPLCKDPKQAAAFSNLLRTVRSFEPTPVFADTDEFLDFVEGKKSSSGVYQKLSSFLGRDSPYLAWIPVVIPSEIRARVASAFTV
jgi:hypothetical protein